MISDASREMYSPRLVGRLGWDSLNFLRGGAVMGGVCVNAGEGQLVVTAGKVGSGEGVIVNGGLRLPVVQCTSKLLLIRLIGGKL